MPDLTFGEQVKIVLSRKGMTIKELAEIIEKRTGKKMSRQNLTQRLGRDNFQEQDMRMIAEILECPFSLSILLEGEEAEAVQAGDKQDKLDAQPKSGGQSKPQPTTKESVRIAKAKARKEKKAKEAERLAEAMERVPSEIRREPVEKEMTLGDYIDIHEELARQETERLPKMSKDGAETAQENRKQPGAGGQAESEKAETQEAKERPEDGKAEMQEAEERPEGGKAETQEAEERPEDGKAETQEAKGQPENGKEEAQEAGKAEEQGSGEEPEAAEDNAEPKVDVEELLREMEELENERRLLEQQVKEAKEAKEAMEQEEHAREEKKITGWRAMFQRRSKKERHEERREEQEIVEQVVLREPAVEELEDDYIEYGEPDTELETDESGTQEENEGQSDMEDIIEELMEEEEDAEDLSRGELNPYTGHEYETNSVRMHPKRIGYVQLYDRRDHGWTDMTEWAFLGYQERKKALLGKDYDPPIYLD